MSMSELGAATGDDVAGTGDREASLWEAFKATGSMAAREALFSIHYPFARQVARRRFLRRSGGDIEFPDLVQMASLGLLEAIDRYKPALGTPFRAYAGKRITGAIADGVAKASEVQEQISHRRRVQSDRVRSLNLAGATPDAPKDPLQALADLAVGLALGFMLEESGLAQPESQADHSPNGYESLAWRETIGRLGREIESLPERESTVIRRHYIDGLAFDQVSALLGLTKGRVSQIHKAAIERLRRRLPRDANFHLKR